MNQMRHWRIFCLAMLAALLAGCPATKKPPTAERFALQNVKSGMCLASTGSGETDSPVVQLDCVPNDPAQVWQWATQGNASYLQQVASRRCLTVQTKSGKAPKAALLQQSQCDGRIEQLWGIADTNNQGSIVVSQIAGGGDAADGWCLDIDRGSTESARSAILWACHKGPSQQWRIVKQ